LVRDFWGWDEGERRDDKAERRRRRRGGGEEEIDGRWDGW
jgi:hypothetical protein